MIWRRFIGGDRTVADLVDGQGIYILCECCGNSYICRYARVSTRISGRVVAPFDKVVSDIRYRRYSSSICTVVNHLSGVAGQASICTGCIIKCESIYREVGNYCVVTIHSYSSTGGSRAGYLAGSYTSSSPVDKMIMRISGSNNACICAVVIRKGAFARRCYVAASCG